MAISTTPCGTEDDSFSVVSDSFDFPPDFPPSPSPVWAGARMHSRYYVKDDLTVFLVNGQVSHERSNFELAHSRVCIRSCSEFIDIF
jgi:hypothetical protein